MFYLQRIVKGHKATFQVELVKDKYSIGRGKNSDILCKSPDMAFCFCSKKHATLFVNGDGTVDIEAENVSSIYFIH
jgi:pSer/pThr/pTyr-binding forkhead associated (FHA) protein